VSVLFFDVSACAVARDAMLLLDGFRRLEAA
jgi:hypothetical protein